MPRVLPPGPVRNKCKEKSKANAGVEIAGLLLLCQLLPVEYQNVQR